MPRPPRYVSQGRPDGPRVVAVDETGDAPYRTFLVVPEDLYDPKKTVEDYPFEEIHHVDETELVPAPPT